MLKNITFIITVILVLTIFGFKKDSVSPTKSTEETEGLPEGLAAPLLTSPLNNYSFTSDDNTKGLIWTSVEDAASYQVQVSDDLSFSNSDIDEQVHSASQYLMNNNMGDGIYYWRISSIDSAGNIGDWSETRTFLVGQVIDIDGNIYKIVKIGEQWWMAENLKVRHYRNGNVIPNEKVNSEWARLIKGAYCAYANKDSLADIYGYLYNWYAVVDSRNIAPAGWHVPTDAEWKEMEMYLGMSQTAADSTGFIGTDEGGKLKATTTHWNSPNTGATNETGFSVIPGGGRRHDNGEFNNIGIYARFWSSSADRTDVVWNRGLHTKYSSIYREVRTRRRGFSLRCVKD